MEVILKLKLFISDKLCIMLQQIILPPVHSWLESFSCAKISLLKLQRLVVEREKSRNQFPGPILITLDTRTNLSRQRRCAAGCLGPLSERAVVPTCNCPLASMQCAVIDPIVCDCEYSNRARRKLEPRAGPARRLGERTSVKLSLLNRAY